MAILIVVLFCIIAALVYIVSSTKTDLDIETAINDELLKEIERLKKLLEDKESKPRGRKPGSTNKKKESK